jgi:isoleucyl-tRNA synthetase
VREVLDRDGSDAMRWFLMSSPVLRGGNLIVTEQGIRDGVRQVLLPYWNTYYFLTLYSNAADGGAGHEPRLRTDSRDVLDRYVLAKTHDLVVTLTGQLDEYDIAGCCAAVREFLDVLTNWYVRRSRERFWAEDGDAFDTLHTVLEVLSRLLAPLLPMAAEEVWRGLTGERSVHLTDWPEDGDYPADAELVTAMDRAREVASAALGLRKAQSLRVRQPLATLTVVIDDPATVGPFEGVIADEVNVKQVRLIGLDGADATSVGVSRRLTVNARAAGPRLGKGVQTVIKAAKAGDWSVLDDESVVSGGVRLEPGEYTLETVVADDSGHTAVAVLPGGGFVVLDTALTPQLEAEGWARDLVRQIQDERKGAGLHVSDRIRLVLAVPADRHRVVREYEELLKRETLADHLLLEAADALAVSLSRMSDTSER